ncbi:ATP-dependent helicase HrpB [Pseudomaricurvus alcaniphilus]|nr:ATP-dependent helicase HrpB [Pseudomaricurvus alcaniphilus]
MALPELPVQAILPELCQQLDRRDEVVLEAPPGAGKTSLVPLVLLEWLQQRQLNGKIMMLEPRRLAARSAAERMAELLGEPVGQTVGYRMRMDTRVSQATRIEVITEGILTRLLQQDPALEAVSVLIFDEFHERSLDADLGLALALQGRELFGDLRPQPLKLLLMSATLDGAGISQLLANDGAEPAPVVSSEGRMFPVQIRYGSPYRPGERIADRVVTSVLQALADEPGSLLVFLPGQAEIRAVQQRLQQHLQADTNIHITPLYGDMPLNAQRQAIAPAAAGSRKIVLATSIAETSLTIEGVRVVIDSGLARLPAFDPSSGMSRLHTRQLSRAAATQRCGRAGRLEEGVCYRLWSDSQQQQLRPFTAPEILQADLAPLALQLLRWGVEQPQELRWLDPPAAAPYQQALDLLQRLGAVQAVPATTAKTAATAIPATEIPATDTHWRLTGHGEAMSQLPLHPRLAHMLLIGQKLGLGTLATELAALLSDRDISTGGGADIQLRLDLLRGERRGQRDQQGALQRLRQQQRQFAQLLSAANNHKPAKSSEPVKDSGAETSHGVPSEYQIGMLLACAYPDRIARRRTSGQDNSRTYQLSNGRAAAFADVDPLQKHTWLAIAQAGSREGQPTDRIYLAASLDPALFSGPLADLVSSHSVVQWHTQTEKLVAEQQRRVGALVWSSEPLSRVPAEDKQAILVELVRKRGLALLPWSEALQQWRQRIELLRQSQIDAGQPWPDFSDQGLLDSLPDWLGPYLEPITQLGDFSRLDLAAILAARLPWPLPQRLQELAPERITVPSGSNIRIDYTHNPPVLAVKLQEMFGCRETPAIANGQIKLLVHLLSPAQRPLQVTQDLAGFWQSSYLEVKKEMKGRYPKHHWPDDPLTAVASARTTRKPRPT